MDLQKKNKGEMTPQKSLKITHILFFGGLGLMAVGLMIGEVWDNATAIAAFGILGVLCAFGGIAFGNIYIKCKECNGSLMSGGRVPGHLPDYCPHCGKRVDDT